MIEEQNMWFPDSDLYQGRIDADYSQKVGDLLVSVTVGLVQQRALEDGSWLIDNHRVGPNNVNEPVMRRMMEWVADETNIMQCIESVGNKGLATELTVEWICRELAMASVMIRGNRASRN